MVCLGTSALVLRPKFCTKEMSCLCFPSRHQPAATLLSHPAPTDTQPSQSTAGSSKKQPTSALTATAFSQPEQAAVHGTLIPLHPEGQSCVSGERHAVWQSCPSCGGFPTISLHTLLECQKRQAGPREKTDRLTQNSRLPRTLPAFSPRQCCEAQQGWHGPQGAKGRPKLEGTTDRRPSPPWLLKIPSVSIWLLGNTQALCTCHAHL